MAESRAEPSAETSYDRVPYRSYAFRQSHPDRLAVIAALHGLNPPRVEEARVLELGCASGGNLIPVADQLPGTTCLGIDLSSRQVEVGQAFAKRAGLKNIELRHQNILEFEAPAGSFDYIICHGVYSWVPDQLQNRILEICGRCLSAGGVAYVSYNTYPGWRMRSMIRDIMQYRAQFFSTPSQQLAQARGLLTFLSESVKAENNAYGILLKNELEAVMAADDNYLFHEHLEDNNEPVYFHQFCGRAARHGLSYLGEADYGSMSLDNFPDRVKVMLQSVSRDVVEIEQYMDFLRNRTFRQTLLSRSDAVFDRVALGRNLLRLSLASQSQPEQEAQLTAEERVTYRRGASVMSTSDPVVKAAMRILKDAWPASVPFLELAASARSLIGEKTAAVQSDVMSPATRQFADTLLKCYASGQVDLHAIPAPFTTTVSERPVASIVSRLQATDGCQVTDRTHGMVTLDDFHRQVLTFLDGKHDSAQLLTALVKRVESDALMVHRDGQRLTNPAEIREVIGSWLQKALTSFAKMALLIG